MNFTFAVFEKTRGFLKTYLETLSLEQLNKVPEGYNNNIIWNIGHLVVTQQVLVYKLSGLPMLVSDELIAAYKKGTRPEANVTEEDVKQIKALLFKTIAQTKIDYNNKIFFNFQEYTPETTGNTLSTVENAMEFALFHEGMHMGVIKGLLNAIKL